MLSYTVHPVGTIRNDENGARVELLPVYAPALLGLDGFGCVELLWWFDGCDNDAARTKLTERQPYRGGPDALGAFATRSPERPNPIALSCAHVTYLNLETGILGLAYTDADDGSPVLDIKPYTPSLDRVEEPAVPGWCADWPRCVEDSGSFDWSGVFNF